MQAGFAAAEEVACAIVSHQSSITGDCDPNAGAYYPNCRISHTTVTLGYARMRPDQSIALILPASAGMEISLPRGKVD